MPPRSARTIPSGRADRISDRQACRAGPALAGADKVVVELFTSQGCSSCPPADRLLGELAARDDVIALSFHVDYWNYLGWNDPFSSESSTNRQRAHRAALGLRYVYTPQIVIGGAAHEVGSHRGKVLRAIERVRATQQVKVGITHPDKKTAIVSVGAGETPSGPATVWLFAYDKSHSTDIGRGENAGVKLVNTHVVRETRKIGEWDGNDLKITLPITMMGIEKQDGCAIVVQSKVGGQIYGAADFPLMGKGS